MIPLRGDAMLASSLGALASPCTLCPRACGARRLAGERGRCGAGGSLRVSAVERRISEEPELRGEHPVVQVFFSGCVLDCDGCVNFDISRGGGGWAPGPIRLASHVASLLSGCPALFLVSPEHQLPWVAAFLDELGLPAPGGPTVVMNTGGFLNPARLEDWSERIDVFLPDFKFGNAAAARRWACPPDYPQIAERVLRAMLALRPRTSRDGEGRLRRGVLVRHLVLPGEVESSLAALRILSELGSGEEILLHLMDHYRPVSRVVRDPRRARVVSAGEAAIVRRFARACGFQLVGGQRSAHRTSGGRGHVEAS